MFFKKNRIKQNIPEDLRLILRSHYDEVQEYNNRPRYSLSQSNEDLNNIKNEIQKIKLEKTFSTILFEHIDNKSIKDSVIYKKAHIDRRLFSKIRSNNNYHPSKDTIIALGLALELSTNELEELLKSAHYSLPTNNYFDIAIRYCFDKQIYDYDKVNDILYACDLRLLSKKNIY